MDKKVFISYTLKGGLLNVNLLKKLQSAMIGQCDLYIDILDNDSFNKQARVEKELLDSDYLFLIMTENVMESNWVIKEIGLAKENDIPIIDLHHDDLLNKFHFVTMYIKHMVDSSNYEVCTFNNFCSGFIGSYLDLPKVSYT